jgi:copper resistance protein B
MKCWYLLLLGSGVTGSALAQHEGHTAAETAVEEPAVNASTTAEAGAVTAAPADPHAGHTMSAEEPAAAAADPHAGHTMPAPAAADAQQGHDMATMTAGDMAARDQPPPPEAFSGPRFAADLVYDPAEMARAREIPRAEHGDFRALFLMADQFEVQSRDGEDAYIWDAQGWYGGDIDKFWFKTEGEGEVNEGPDEIEVQTLWSHAIHPWFDFQAGARLDFESGFERSHLVLGFQGLAPYSFEVDAAAFISDDGDVTARFEGEYDVWLTQRLILQPRLEFELAAQDIPERAIGSGLSSAEIGARLHYQIVREVAPYFGVEYQRLFSGTADAAQRAGEDAGGWNVVLGIRTWF